MIPKVEIFVKMWNIQNTYTVVTNSNCKNSSTSPNFGGIGLGGAK